MTIRNRITFALSLAFAGILSAVLFSFSSNPGGDHFEIYLNKKLVLQQGVAQTGQVKNIDLNVGDQQGQLEVYYSHCGELGKSRSIILRAGKTVVKQWRFTGTGKFMSVAARDIIQLPKKPADGKLELYYLAEQLPTAKMLASISINSNATHGVTP